MLLNSNIGELTGGSKFHLVSLSSRLAGNLTVALNVGQVVYLGSLHEYLHSGSDEADVGVAQTRKSHRFSGNGRQLMVDAEKHLLVVLDERKARLDGN